MNIVNQISNFTKENRYTEIFCEIKNIISDRNNLKILSFGCSTGEECKTLCSYFPDALITGYDICEDIINKNILNNQNKNIIYTNNSNDLLLNKYDIIFCMSVLCVWPERMGNYTIEQFNNTLLDIDKLLDKGGYLCIYNSKFLFSDSVVFCNYELVKTKYKDTGFVTKYSNNKIINNYEYYLFLKIK